MLLQGQVGGCCEEPEGNMSHTLWTFGQQERLGQTEERQLSPAQCQVRDLLSVAACQGQHIILKAGV